MECNLHDSFAIFSNVVDPFLLRSSSRTMSMSVTVKKYVWASVVKHTSNVRQSACLYDIKVSTDSSSSMSEFLLVVFSCYSMIFLKTISHFKYF